MNMQFVAAVEERGGIGSRFTWCIIHNPLLRLYQYLNHTRIQTRPCDKPNQAEGSRSVEPDRYFLAINNSHTFKKVFHLDDVLFDC